MIRAQTCTHPAPTFTECLSCGRAIAPGRALNGHTYCQYCTDESDQKEKTP